MRHLYLILAIAALAFVGCNVDDEGREFFALDTPELENAHVLTSKVITGAEPKGAESFRTLREWGVKTVISVDGAKPDLENAHAQGIRYVHLPLGYDGIKQERAELVAKAILESEGRVYVHCHHGKHRGPAAAAAACVVLGELVNAEAVRALQTIGTGEEYQGLWKAARETKRVCHKNLKKIDCKFVESAPVPPLAEAMVHADEVMANLKLCQEAGWKTPQDHKDLEPAHEALKMRELFFEMMRTEAEKSRPEEYRKMSKATEDAARALETKLREKDLSAEDRAKAAGALFMTLKQSCTDCHKTYRNNSW
ncbi:MAG TPA: hypothetical protein VEJ63_14395 [Planctomycetota bacterium]|nr:hypothetical protein [Planctomycetota bacterium]